MKIKIDKYGHLYIERAGNMKKQWCPYSNTEVCCGDWCPMFADNALEEDDMRPYVVVGCTGKYLFGDLEDER